LDAAPTATEKIKEVKKGKSQAKGFFIFSFWGNATVSILDTDFHGMDPLRSSSSP
jgi:ABC-type uncharacterized transport system ATPase subunit